MAEGVKTDQALKMLTMWGGEEAQDYLLAKPLAPAAFLHHVRFSGLEMTTPRVR